MRSYHSLGLIIFLLTVTACTRPVSTKSVTQAPPSDPAIRSIEIERVQVNNGVSIEVNGSASLPEGGCLQTELLEDGQPVAWWPKDACLTPDDRSQWQMVVRLGRQGTPQALDLQAQYELHAWWPEDRENVQARFPFDLQSPP